MGDPVLDFDPLVKHFSVAHWLSEKLGGAAVLALRLWVLI